MSDNRATAEWLRHRPIGWPTRWRGRTWASGDGYSSERITEEHLYALWVAMPHEHEMRLALAVPSDRFPVLGGRRAGKALQLLRHAKLASYNRERGEWERTTP